MSDSETQIQDHSADYYVNSRYKGYGLKYHSNIIHEMMEELDGRILDVGCGTGIISELYPDLDLIGIDCSPGMLRHHKGKYLLASATEIPFPDSSFDAVICRSVLHHLPNPNLALTEINRVLKPGGKFVCWETNASWLAQIVRRFTQHGDRFSDYHTSFDRLDLLISKYFKSSKIKYQGFIAYPLLGFPDIINFNTPNFLFNPLIEIDELLSRSWLKKFSFAIMIKATK